MKRSFPLCSRCTLFLKRDLFICQWSLPFPAFRVRLFFNRFCNEDWSVKRRSVVDRATRCSHSPLDKSSKTSAEMILCLLFIRLSVISVYGVESETVPGKCGLLLRSMENVHSPLISSLMISFSVVEIKVSTGVLFRFIISVWCKSCTSLPFYANDRVVNQQLTFYAS